MPARLDPEKELQSDVPYPIPGSHILSSFGRELLEAVLFCFPTD
jgi:hypothetical protein